MHDLSPKPSIGLTALALALHTGGLMGTLYAAPPIIWPIVLALLGASLWRSVSRRPGDVARSQGQIDAEWTLTFRDNRREAGWRVDVQRSFCHPLLVILVLRRARQRRYLALAADAVSADALRRLRVSLRAAG